MTPEGIKNCLEILRPALVSRRLKAKGQGYSFWLGTPGMTNRILRASRRTPSSSTIIKLAVSSRLPDIHKAKRTEFMFDGTVTELTQLVDEEMKLYAERIGRSTSD